MSAAPIGIEQIGLYLPPTRTSVEDLGGPLGLSPLQVRFFTRYLGLRRIAMAPEIGLAEMLVRAGEDALRTLERDRVRFLVYAHTMQHATTAAPTLLEEVRAALGLRRATVFGLSHLNCVAGLHAPRIAQALLQGSAPGEKVLLLTGDKITSHRLRMIPDTTVLGEAATATVLGHDDPGDRVIGRATRVLGRFYQCLDWSEELSAEYKSIYTRTLRTVMAEAIADAGRTPAEVTLLLPHNVNRLSWKRICADLGIGMDRVFLDNVPEYGHCYNSDPFINLRTVRDRGLVSPGDLVLLAAAGLGATFAAALVEIGESPRPVPRNESEPS